MFAMKKTLAMTATILFSFSNDVLSQDSTKVVEMRHFAPRVRVGETPLKLKCENTAPNFLVALDLAMAEKGITVGKDAELWQVEAFGVFGYTLDLPKEKKDKDLARRVLEFARHDNLVAAKLANDNAALESSSYAKSLFHRDVTLYIQNNSRPDAPIDGKLNEHEKWLTQAAEAVDKAKKMLGALRAKPSIRNYVLGSIYDDGLAVSAAEKVLCKEADEKVMTETLKIAKIVKTRKP